MATPPSKPTVKEQRAAKRAAQLEAFKKKEAARKRNRVLGIVAAVTTLVLVVGTIATVLVLNSLPRTVDEALVSGDYEDRVQLFPDLGAGHTQGSVNYPQTPPAGGPHNPAWLNCGIYEEPQTDEYAVHSLEHGAVWITYDPRSTSDADVEALRGIARDLGSYTIVSPYPGIGDAMAISAWGAQLRFTDPDDPAVQQFITEYWRSADAPEPGASCSGAIEGPGKVS